MLKTSNHNWGDIPTLLSEPVKFIEQVYTTSTVQFVSEIELR